MLQMASKADDSGWQFYTPKLMRLVPLHLFADELLIM